MVSKIKLIERIESKPYKVDITFDELRSYLEYFGYKVNRQKGSHVNFVHPLGIPITIPNNKKYVKPCYVKLAVECVSTIKEE